MSEPTPEAARSDLEYDTDAAIEGCGGDARAAVAALLVANFFLEAEIDQLKASISSGFGRGRVVKPAPKITAGTKKTG
jgi:hypothetical protein